MSLHIKLTNDFLPVTGCIFCTHCTTHPFIPRLLSQLSTKKSYHYFCSLSLEGLTLFWQLVHTIKLSMSRNNGSSSRVFGLVQRFKDRYKWCDRSSHMVFCKTAMHWLHKLYSVLCKWNTSFSCTYFKGMVSRCPQETRWVWVQKCTYLSIFI